MSDETTKEQDLERAEEIQARPDKLVLQGYDLSEITFKLWEAFKDGYVPEDNGCAYRIGLQIYVNLVQETEKKKIRKEEIKIQKEAKAEKERLLAEASTPDTEEAPTLVNEDGKELLDEKTKEILDIDWELLSKKALEGDKDFIKDMGLRYDVTLSKAKKADNMVKDFKEAMEVR